MAKIKAIIWNIMKNKSGRYRSPYAPEKIEDNIKGYITPINISMLAPIERLTSKLVFCFFPR